MFNPPAADEGLIPAPRGDYNFPLDTPLLAAGQFIWTYKFTLS